MEEKINRENNDEKKTFGKSLEEKSSTQEEMKELQNFEKFHEEFEKLEEEEKVEFLEGFFLEQTREVEEDSENLWEQVRSKQEELVDEPDSGKKVEFAKEVHQLYEKIFRNKQEWFNLGINFYELKRVSYKNLVEEGGEEIIELQNELEGLVDKKEEGKKRTEIEMGMMKVSRWGKGENLYEKAIDYLEDLKEKKKKLWIEFLQGRKVILERMKQVAEKEKTFAKERLEKKREKLREEIEREKNEIERENKKFEEKKDKEYSELTKEEDRKLKKIKRTIDILNYAKESEEIYIDIFVELQEMNEATEKTAKTLERTEKLQKETATIQERIEKNTSTSQQFKTAFFSAVCGAILVAILAAVFNEIIRRFFS